MTPPGWQIGQIKLANPLVLAPMAGVTDLAFRLLCREAGAALVATEMISDLALLGSSRRSHEILTISQYEHPVSCQLCGSRPESMAKAALAVAEAGADIVDINMGCPAPKIVSNQEGAALMRQPSRAAEIIAAIRNVLPDHIPLTVKIRAGWDEQTVNAVEFATMLERAGVSAITVHARVRSQFYAGRADWSIIKQVKEAVRVPVTGNGDVWTPHDAQEMLSQTGCDHVMIGRAVLGNPGIFTQCLQALGMAPEDLPLPDVQSLAIRHFRAATALKGEHRGMVEMRKHGAWYIAGRRGAARLRQQLMQADTALAAEACLRQALAGGTLV